MARLGYPFYPADPSNYSRGRERPIRKITIHHSAGWEQTLRYLWGNASRNGSSHFWVGNKAGHIEQYVDTANTAWTNSNWASNNESITIETRGDWRGYYDAQTLLNLRALIKKILQTHGALQLEFHMDVARNGTLCPADLKHKGYAKAQFDAAVKDLVPPKPPEPNIVYEKITPKRILLKQTTNLWDFNFTKWSDAKAVKSFGQGSVIDVVATATNALGAKYYMTAYSYNNGAIRATNGFNVVDCVDYVPPKPVEPPKPEPTWEPLLTPRKMRLLTASHVVNLDTMQEIGDIIPEGTDIDLATKKTDKNNVVWARSKWATEKNQNTGIQLDRFGEVPATEPEPEPEPTPEPPIDIDPTEPGNGDVSVEDKLNLIIRILKAIAGFFKIDW